MKKPKPSPERIKELIAAGVPEDAEDMEEALKERTEMAELLAGVLDREESRRELSDEQVKTLESLLASLRGKAAKAGA
jgi:cbb3-type cytochrome oxidase cytochrome c subunit